MAIQGWRPDQPWNELPCLPPEVDLQSKEILRRCIPARVALAELKQSAELIPNPAMLINTIPLLEARASSEIENIVTTNDRLFRFHQHEDQADPATREALRHRQALLDGFRSLQRKPLGTRTAERVCSIIKGCEMRVRRIPGTALVDTKGEIVYTPPVGESRLRDLLADWERFLHNETGLDPLIRMAVGHYQFEAIHPFTDGNGRTGRVLNSLFLIGEKLLTQPILYLSRYVIRHRTDYYRLLNAVTRENAWEPWILFILDGVAETAVWTSAKINAIRALAERTDEHIRARHPKFHSRELVDIIFEQPYCRIQNLVERGIAKRETASKYLKALCASGVLEEVTLGRDKLFVQQKLLRLLTRDSDQLEREPRKV